MPGDYALTLRRTIRPAIDPTDGVSRGSHTSQFGDLRDRTGGLLLRDNGKWPTFNFGRLIPLESARVLDEEGGN